MLTNAIEAVGLWVFLGLLTVLAIATSPLWMPAAVITGYRRGVAGPEILEYREFYLWSMATVAVGAVALWLTA